MHCKCAWVESTRKYKDKRFKKVEIRIWILIRSGIIYSIPITFSGVKDSLYKLQDLKNYLKPSYFSFS